MNYPVHKVLVNGLNLKEKYSGVSYYIHYLLKFLDRINSRQRMTFIDAIVPNYKISDYELEQLKLFTPAFEVKSPLRRILYENLFLSSFFSKHNYSLLHSTSYTLPFFWKKPSVLTIHDLISLDYPEFCKNETAIHYKSLIPISIKSSNRIIACSNRVKQDILRRFSIAEERIAVIHLGIDKIFRRVQDMTKLEQIRRKYSLPHKYILFVGNIEPKKNLERTISAFYQVKTNSEIPHHFVIVGQKGWKYKSVFSLIDHLKINDIITMLGYVDQDDLPAIYSLSDLFVFPSLYEGFGLPALEAMACEVPVLISNAGSLPEITGSIYHGVDPCSVEEISAYMHEYLTNTTQKNQLKAGKEWSRNFSWEKTANMTNMIYESLLKEV